MAPIAIAGKLRGNCTMQCRLAVLALPHMCVKVIVGLAAMHTVHSSVDVAISLRHFQHSSLGLSQLTGLPHLLPAQNMGIGRFLLRLLLPVVELSALSRHEEPSYSEPAYEDSEDVSPESESL
jgi:hypothetical protein